MNLLNLSESASEKLAVYEDNKITPLEIAEECRSIVSDNEKGRTTGEELFNAFKSFASHTGYSFELLLKASKNPLLITHLN